MPKKGTNRAVSIEGWQKPTLTIPMAPIPLAANEIMALVVFGTLSESLFLIPLISETFRDCREVSMHNMVNLIRLIKRRFEGDKLTGASSGISQRVDLFIAEIGKKFPTDQGAWVISAFSEFLAKWKKMAKKTYPRK